MPNSYLFVMWAGGGNVGPFLVLAEWLLERGHTVSALATEALHPRLGAAGIEVEGAPPGSLPGFRDVMEALERGGPDILVVDYMLTEALCAAERSGLPTVALVHTLYAELLQDGAPHPIGMAGSVDALNAVRSEAGLAPIESHADLLAAPDLVLVTAPRELDAPGALPANVKHVGALIEAPGPDGGWSPPRGEGPLAVVSLGTVGHADADTDLTQRVLHALGQLPVRGLVTLPDYIAPGDLEWPRNVTASGYVRHAAVLPHADLLVTHAGLGSVVTALAWGVPMVCRPLRRDQPDNARAVVRLGAGCALDAGAAPGAIAVAIRGQLASEVSVRLEPTPSAVVDLIESLAGRPPAGRP